TRHHVKKSMPEENRLLCVKVRSLTFMSASDGPLTALKHHSSVPVFRVRMALLPHRPLCRSQLIAGHSRQIPRTNLFSNPQRLPKTACCRLRILSAMKASQIDERLCLKGAIAYLAQNNKRLLKVAYSNLFLPQIFR